MLAADLQTGTTSRVIDAAPLAAVEACKEHEVSGQISVEQMCSYVSRRNVSPSGKVTTELTTTAMSSSLGDRREEST